VPQRSGAQDLVACSMSSQMNHRPLQSISQLLRPSSDRMSSICYVIDLLVSGGFPVIRPLEDRDRTARYDSYVNSIVERDIAPVAEIRRPDTLRRMINQLAHRTAEELNVTSLCSALGARKETVNTYLDILSRLGIVHRLGAWTASGARKEVRSPKLHFMDTGCATALRGEDAASFGLRADPVALGHILESFVFCELEKSLPLLKRRWDLYHWRYAPERSTSWHKRRVACSPSSR